MVTANITARPVIDQPPARKLYPAVNSYINLWSAQHSGVARHLHCHRMRVEEDYER